MKRTIVTGGTGFVGANLARRLLRDGHEVNLLVRSGYAPWRIAEIRNDVRLHEVSLGDPDQLQQIVTAIRPDWVFHLAVHGAYSSQTDLRAMVETNILGTINLIQACLAVGFEVLVNTGASSEYGFKDHAPSEDEGLEPNSSYAFTKASGTLFCRHTAQRYRVRIPTLRLYSVYGPYEEPTRLIPTLVIRGLGGELPPLVDPSVARDYVYIEDIDEVYLLAATHDTEDVGAVYNIGTGVQTTLRQVIEVARRVMSIIDEPVWGSMPERQWDTNSWVADSRKIQRELGWSPRYTFEEGLCSMVEWFHAHPTLAEFYQRRVMQAT